MFAPAGTGAEKGNIAGARQYRNCQFMTPETRRTTHFFWNYLHNFDLDDPNIALSLCNSLREGFMEDKAIIEAQQKLFDREPDTTLLAIVADAPLAHFRRVFGQRLARSSEAQGGDGASVSRSMSRRRVSEGELAPVRRADDGLDRPPLPLLPSPAHAARRGSTPRW